MGKTNGQLRALRHPQFPDLPRWLEQNIAPSCIQENLADAKRIREGADPKEIAEHAAHGIEARLASNSIALSTETVVADHLFERLGLVSAICIYGSHLGKDIMSSFRDLVGGRSTAIEQVFNDATNNCLSDLRFKAHQMGATEIFAIQLHHQELAGGGKSMVMVTASGTAVRRRAG